MFSRRTIHRLNAAINYLETSRRLYSLGLRPSLRVRRKDELFDLIIKRVEQGRTLYLEFGVFQGESMRYWSSHLTNPLAQLHGFDSFIGLPENWNIDSSKGFFSTNGEIPKISDPRVRLFKGWFEETLPVYQPPEHDQLVINMDADIYSSTAYVLGKIESMIDVGTYIYFDESADRFNELEAFTELQERTQMKFDLIGANEMLSQVVLQRIG
jgi:Macrocin-O-methyltransferase (TylF)